MSNAKWKIVPVEPTPEMIAAADKACASQFPTNKEYFLAEYPAALATAPEPDWEALVELALDAYVDSPSLDIRENMRAALKAAFGSKP